MHHNNVLYDHDVYRAHCPRGRNGRQETPDQTGDSQALCVAKTHRKCWVFFLSLQFCSHYSWPMTLNKQLLWTMVWASLPVQLSNTSIQLVWGESVKQLSTTTLNSFIQARQIMAAPMHRDTARQKNCEYMTQTTHDKVYTNSHQYIMRNKKNNMKECM